MASCRQANPSSNYSVFDSFAIYKWNKHFQGDWITPIKQFNWDICMFWFPPSDFFGLYFTSCECKFLPEANILQLCETINMKIEFFYSSITLPPTSYYFLFASFSHCLSSPSFSPVYLQMCMCCMLCVYNLSTWLHARAYLFLCKYCTGFVCVSVRTGVCVCACSCV